MYIGLLTKNANGDIASHTCPIDQVAIANHQQILFAAAADDELLVQQALNAVASMYGVAPPPPTPRFQNPPGDYYVYAYFNNLNDSAWDDCFYIGKGKGNRWTAHVGERSEENLPQATSAKNRHIDAWVAAQRDAATAPLTAQKLIAAAKQQGLVRKLGQWSGPFAEACAFAAEHFLIRGLLGVYELANNTGGNNQIGNLRILVRDKGLDMNTPSHATAWCLAVDTFVCNPDAKILNNRIRPSLHLLSYQTLFASLDQSLAQIGLFPQARNYFDPIEFPSVPSHASVEGASDPCLSYVTNDQRPFRVQLKLSRCNDGTVVNVRPRVDGVRGRHDYFQYFQNININGSPLVNHYGGNLPIIVPGAPYFKPFAQDGNGINDTLFPLNAGQGVVTGYANWMQGGHFNLNLRDALNLFLNSFTNQAGGWTEHAFQRVPIEHQLPPNLDTMVAQSEPRGETSIMNANMPDEWPLSYFVVRATVSARLAYEFEADRSAVLTVNGDSGHVLLEKKFRKVNLEKLVAWSLSYGAEIEILEPLQLREQVANRVKFAIDFFYGPSETDDRVAISRDVYIPSGMSPDDALHAAVEKKLFARRDLKSIEEVPATERFIKLWIDTRRLNPFDNTPLMKGSVSMDFLAAQNNTDMIMGLCFEGEWLKSTGWVLSCCDSVCVQSPKSYRREITEIMNKVDQKYRT
jgi:hypothetical protein